MANSQPSPRHSTEETMTKTIDGIVLSDFIEILLGRADSVHCQEYIADKLYALDPEETYVHIERPNAENEVRYITVWRSKAWRDSYMRHLRKKELSARERQVFVLASELRIRVVKKLCGITGLTEEQALKVAIPLIRTRNEKLCQELFGLKLDELQAADTELDTYKQKIGKK